MYVPRNPAFRKNVPEMRWALPDRVFFACGACHILAHAFLERWGGRNMEAVWIKPDAGHIGNHVFVDAGAWVFDYHGYCARSRFLEHTWRRARQLWPRWAATLVPLPSEALISEPKSREYHGLWLRKPSQFLYDAMPRARVYLDRFQAPPEAET